MPTKCGAYTTVKTPSEESKEVLKKNFKEIVSLHEELGNLNLDNLLSNHTYATQVVAGLKYKFMFKTKTYDATVHILQKLNQTFEVSLESLKCKI
jgi:hypothetical protein